MYPLTKYVSDVVVVQVGTRSGREARQDFFLANWGYIRARVVWMPGRERLLRISQGPVANGRVRST
jgi:hypothetical protein